MIWLAVLIFQPVRAEGITFFEGSLAELQREAIDQGKLIFIDAWADWCQSCKEMEKKTFSDPAVASFFNEHFLSWRLDMDKSPDLDEFEVFRISKLPDYLFLNPQGMLQYRASGFMDAEELIGAAKAAIKGQGHLLTYRGDYDAGNRDAQFVSDYLMALDVISANSEVERIGKDYLSMVKTEELIEDKYWDIIFLSVHDLNTREFNFVLDNYDKFVEKHGKDQVDDVVVRVYERTFEVLAEKPDEKLLQASKRVIKTVLDSPLEADALILNDAMSYYAFHKIWDKYAEVTVELMSKYPPNSASGYNDPAWAFFLHVEEPDKLEKAVEWAKTSAELEKMHYNLDTAASLLFKLGKLDEAEKMAKEAIVVGESMGENMSPTKELLQKIASAGG